MQADSYSRAVGWLKIILPLAALALLSTLFLLSRVVDPEAVIPFADKEIQDRLRDQQVTGPVYRGTTAEGDQISFAAARLISPPGQTGSNRAENIEVVVDMAAGTNVRLTASQGDFAIQDDVADLQGDVNVTTSTGYEISSQRMITQLSRVEITSPGPVTALGPPGTLNAGQMHLISGQAGSAAQLVFTNGVKLVYDPKQHQE